MPYCFISKKEETRTESWYLLERYLFNTSLDKNACAYASIWESRFTGLERISISSNHRVTAYICLCVVLFWKGREIILRGKLVFGLCRFFFFLQTIKETNEYLKNRLYKVVPVAWPKRCCGNQKWAWTDGSCSVMVLTACRYWAMAAIKLIRDIRYPNLVEGTWIRWIATSTSGGNDWWNWLSWNINYMTGKGVV